MTTTRARSWVTRILLMRNQLGQFTSVRSEAPPAPAKRTHRRQRDLRITQLVLF